MNLLMLTGDTSLPRGAQGAFYNTLSEFAPYWDKIDVLTPPVRGVTQYDCFGNVTLYPSPLPKLAQPLFVWRKSRELAANRSYHLIVSHDYGLFLNGLGAAWLSRTTGIPYISEIHHVEGYPRAANLRERAQPVLTRLYARWARSRALGFRITNESELKPLLTRWGVPAEKIFLLHSLYLDFDVFRPDLTGLQDLSGLKHDAIFCGRLVPNKAPFLFLEALVLARQRLGSVRGLVVGQGPLGSKMKARVRALGLDVTFIDAVKTQNELAQLYRGSRCLVCTSFSEGGPRVVAEALACGVPVITTRVGLAGELVRDGENGFQINWSARELADRLAQIASDDSLRAQLSANAPRAVQRFEKSRVIRAYAMAYRGLIKT